MVFALLNILRCHLVNLHPNYVFKMHMYAVNFLMPWGFQTASFSELFRKLFNHLGKSDVAKNLMFTYYLVVYWRCEIQ